jgi:hypothetical protein
MSKQLPYLYLILSFLAISDQRFPLHSGSYVLVVWSTFIYSTQWNIGDNFFSCSQMSPNGQVITLYLFDTQLPCYYLPQNSNTFCVRLIPEFLTCQHMNKWQLCILLRASIKFQIYEDHALYCQRYILFLYNNHRWYFLQIMT